MSDDADPVLAGGAVLRAAVTPIGEEFDRWQIGGMTFSDAEPLRLVESRGLVEAP